MLRILISASVLKIRRRVCGEGARIFEVSQRIKFIFGVES
jgi:hypothetical protein